MSQMKVIINCILGFILFINFIQFSSADYYANLKIIVHNDGTVEIDGDSNHYKLQDGIYSNFTTKNEGYWVLDISTKERFSNYTYQLTMPKNIEINYLGVYAIDSFFNKENLKISGTVTNKPFKIIIQYKKELISSDYFWLYFIIIILISGLSIGFLYKKKRKKKKKYLKHKFTVREYEIIELLQKNKKGLSQIKIEKMTGIPKASLYRNLESLKRKEVITKTAKGMTNHIMLKK
jgi:uncharacterized membrane protein